MRLRLEFLYQRVSCIEQDVYDYLVEIAPIQIKSGQRIRHVALDMNSSIDCVSEQFDVAVDDGGKAERFRIAIGFSTEGQQSTGKIGGPSRRRCDQLKVVLQFGFVVPIDLKLIGLEQDRRN